MSDNKNKTYPGWTIVALGIILMTFGYSCVVSISGVFMLPVTSELNVQIGSFALWISIMSLTGIITLVIVSKLFSQKTIKPILIIGCICGIIGFAGFATSHSLMQFYLCAVPLGICFSCVTTTPCSLLVNNWYGAKIRGKYLGIVFGGNSLAVMGVIPLTNYIVQHYSWRSAYFILAICLLICIPLVIKFAVWSPEMKGLKRPGDIEADDASGSKPSNDFSFSENLKRPVTWIVFISGSLLVIASAAILTYSQPFMMQNGYSDVFASNIVSIMIGICLVTCTLVGHISDKFGIRFGAVLTGVAFVIAYLSQIFIPSMGMPMVILFVIGYGIGCPAVNIITPLLCNHLFGDNSAPFIGYANMFISVGGALSATIIGKLIDITRGYVVPFCVCAILLAIMTVLRFIVTSPKFKYKK